MANHPLTEKGAQECLQLACALHLMKIALRWKIAATKGYTWHINARPKQLMPPAFFHTWLIMAGRGFGKTRLGAETIAHLMRTGEKKRIAVIGATIDDVRSVMIEGESGLLQAFPPWCKINYTPSLNCLTYKNTKVEFYSSEAPQRLRGPQFDAVWIDELAKFREPLEVWRQVMLSLRLGEKPFCIITTTPQDKPLLHALVHNPYVYLTTGETIENKSHLSPVFLDQVNQQFSRTRLAEQELKGKLLSNTSQYLFKPHMIQYKGIYNDNDI